MTLIEWIFYFFGGTTILSALLVLLNRNVLYNAFFLLLSFLSIAALYVFAGADFIAVTQIMVYVGGILVLLIFGVMFTNRSKEEIGVFAGNRNVIAGIGSAIALFVLLATAIQKTNFDAKSIQTTQGSKIEQLGEGLMTHYLIPFELSAILLLAALIGAALIAWKGSQKQ